MDDKNSYFAVIKKLAVTTLSGGIAGGIVGGLQEYLIPWRILGPSADGVLSLFSIGTGAVAGLLNNFSFFKNRRLTAVASAAFILPTFINFESIRHNDFNEVGFFYTNKESGPLAPFLAVFTIGFWCFSLLPALAGNTIAHAVDTNTEINNKSKMHTI